MAFSSKNIAIKELFLHIAPISIHQLTISYHFWPYSNCKKYGYLYSITVNIVNYNSDSPTKQDENGFPCRKYDFLQHFSFLVPIDLALDPAQVLCK